MKLKFFVLLSVFLVVTGVANAQSEASPKKDYVARESNIGITAGALGYAGRYSVKAPLGSHTSFNVSAFYDHNVGIPSKLFLRGEAMFGQLKGDNKEVNTDLAKGDFKTNILEGTIKGQYNFMDDNITNWSPYVILGVGAYGMFNYESSREMKAKKDKMGFILPAGVGVKYKVSDRGRIFLEGNARFFAKNLDGHRGDGVNNPNKYYSLNLGFAYSLKRKNQLW